VYSELTSNHAVPADYLYPSEAAIIESVFTRLRIELNHPKLLQIGSYLTDIPSARSSSGHDKTSIERLVTTTHVIRSALERA
jgi:hypothetical protein